MSACREDETLRNAIEFLTHKDAESALVYALVHDPEFRLASALTASAQYRQAQQSGVDVAVVRALLQVFDTYEDQLRRFIALRMLREMIDTHNWNELFRANSATTAIIREYTCDLGLEFLQAAFQEVLAELWDTTESFEVNPLLLQPEDDLEANQRRLKDLATRLLDRVFDAVGLFPYQIAKIYRVMEVEMARLIERERRSNLSLPRLSAISEDLAMEERKSSASLPRLSAISEDLLNDELVSARSSSSSQSSSGPSSNQAAGGLSPAKEEFYVHLGGFLFLRFLCPALIMPHKLGLTPNGEAPPKTLQRTLVLVAKLFQSLANNVEYGIREKYMAPFNDFLANNRMRLFQFYDKICQQALNDSRRESLILRSNVTPRISQLLRQPTIGTGYGLLGSEHPLDTIEDSLHLLQQWMAENLSLLVKEVMCNGKSKRRNDMNLGPNARTSVKKNKKNSPKRRLKSARGLSPIVISSDDDSESERGNEREDAMSTATRAAPVVPTTVSPDELQRLMGHTTHRDIQLMKIYYTRLSVNGLERLLDVNHESHAHEWVPYRTRNYVSVHRRNPAKQCPVTLKSERERFVEMKSHVEIAATPRQVFKYLRTLEKMTEWDERVANVRKVEPLDDSRVIMYRAHPKLSLWPTWLVKPRDSCDLHSFVDKTGRPDTYAVLMESIRRPDVPEVKGTVRMAFATGGFLVEPIGSTGSTGERTKLTCVVKADFKGHLPRYLAESVCFRQVLSVRTIKLRLESSIQHTNASWV